MTREQKIQEALRQLEYCVQENETDSFGTLYYTLDKHKAEEVLRTIF